MQQVLVNLKYNSINKKIKSGKKNYEILITTNTLSSSIVAKKI